MPGSPKIVLVGAGIGGLAAAAAMHRMGLEVEVHERASEIGEVGAGLQLGPNAVKVLSALGLEEALLEVGAEPVDMISVRHDTAELRFRDPLKSVVQEQYGARYVMAHRADLHRLLAGLLPEGMIHTSRRCTSVATRNGGAVAQFDDGSEVTADVVVAADGIHSQARAGLWGRDAPRFTNQICWRAQVPASEMPKWIGPNGSVEAGAENYVGWLGPNGHVLCYPIRGGEVTNIFAGRVSDDDWAEESWSMPSTIEEMVQAYDGWNSALLELFTKVTQVYKWGIFDRDPLDTWVKGRVALLGDAAHPMMPTLAQGAAMAIEDGYALARHLAHTAEVDVALAGYDAERRPRASGVQLQARQQFENNRKVPAPPPLSRDWIFAHDATRFPDGVAA